jgi:hypothetical protein
MECDSYIHWASMLSWGPNMDPTKPYYMGQQIQADDDIFAYGGSTIIISNPAIMTMMNERHCQLVVDTVLES